MIRPISVATTRANKGQLTRDSLRGRVADRVRQMILDGTYGVGQRLPTVQELSSLLGVSSSTTREALIQLQTRGLVEIKHGQGVFVASGASSPFTTELTTLLQEEGLGVNDLHEVRHTIETACAQLAAERASPQQVAELESVLERMESQAEHIDQYVALDIELHVRIAAASGNPLFERLVTSLRNVYEAEVSATARFPGAYEEGMMNHRRVVEAIKKHDARAAGQAMSGHMDQVRRLIGQIGAAN